MASAFVEILADVNFVSIAITRTNKSVAAIAGKGWITASAARTEAGLSAVLQRTSDRIYRVVPQHVVLQSRRILKVGSSVSSRCAKDIWSHSISPPEIFYPTHEPSSPLEGPLRSHFGSRSAQLTRAARTGKKRWTRMAENVSVVLQSTLLAQVLLQGSLMNNSAYKPP